MPESVGNEANSVDNAAPFIRFNLAPSATQVDHESGSFVASGYKVVSETQSNGDVWYTVVAE